MKIVLDVNCKVCGSPGKVETDNSLPCMEGLLSLFTCDNCMIRMGRLKAKQRELPIPDIPKPYADH